MTLNGAYMLRELLAAFEYVRRNHEIYATLNQLTMLTNAEIE
jgi:hypothetical protein